MMLCLLPLSAWGQRMPLWHGEGGARLDFDADRLWNYNGYEHSRWGGGLWLDCAPRRTNGDRLGFELWAGYGLRNRELKGGLGFEVKFGRSRCGLTQYIYVGRDYVAAASRQMGSQSLLDLGGLSTLLNRRLSDRAMVVWGYRWQAGRTSMAVDATGFAGGRLFDATRLLYRTAGDTIAEEDGAELNWSMRTPAGLSVRATLAATWPERALTARLLVQYRHTFSLRPFEMGLYLQGGITPPRTPYVYMYDLGGTAGVPFLFDRTMLSAGVNEYTANAFGLSDVRLGLQRPLFSIWNKVLVVGSKPRPFVEARAMWGHLWGQDGEGCLEHEGFRLQAPHRGVVEAVAGADALLLWGVTEWGAAVAWRVWPEAQARPAVFFTARLSL